MPRPFSDLYSTNHALTKNRSVAFECSSDSDVWPWLNLNPVHPILIQTINFWASVDSGEFLGTFDPEVWTALTHVEWTCGPPSVGLPVRGIYGTEKIEGRERYTLEFFDASDRQVVRLSGQGVTFRTRNFEGWRGETKKKIVKPEPPAFSYADKAAVGVETSVESFLAPLTRGEKITTTGLITKQNGLRPAHPYIGGSGDHVNSTHMGEVGRQFCELLLGKRLINTGGEMRFHHYVELGTPFQVEMLDHSEAAKQVTLIVRQAERDCTEITMQYAPAQLSPA